MRAMAARAAAAAPAMDGNAAALRYTTGMLVMCLFLQRFGLPMGASKIFNIVGPLGIGLSVLGLLRGVLAFNRFRLFAFLALCACAMIGLSWHALQPGGGMEGAEPNMQSLSQFLLLTSFAILTFAEPMDEKVFFRTVNFWLAVIAVAGIIQFVVQFAGIRIFMFTGILPKSILMELGYWNLEIPLGIGEIYKSNGFFLVEPSVMSQLMAMGLIIEMLAFRRPRFLGLYVAGLLLSFSGTGWLVLISFVLAAAIGMGWRGIGIALGTVLLLATLVGAAAWFLPSLADSLFARVHEFNTPGTSGHLRFVTPFWVMHDMLAFRPDALWFGLGAGVSERLNLAYDYNVNTPIKIVLDFGLPALVLYLSLFIGGRKSPLQASITVPAMMLFLIAGGYQQFPPLLFLILLMICVARLEVRPADASALA